MLDGVSHMPNAFNQGTRWKAPEIFDPEDFGFHASERTRATDVYAFACVCLEVRRFYYHLHYMV
jgi:hypothetical protein